MVPWPAYSNKTHAQLLTAYNNALTFTGSHWSNTPNDGSYGSIGWYDRQFAPGIDYLCGDAVSVYNGPHCGHSYAIYSHQKAYRTGAIRQR